VCKVSEAPLSSYNATTHHAARLAVWRQKVVCLFGKSLNGTPTPRPNPFDRLGAVTWGSTNGTPSCWNYFKPYDGVNRRLNGSH